MNAEPFNTVIQPYLKNVNINEYIEKIQIRGVIGKSR